MIIISFGDERKGQRMTSEKMSFNCFNELLVFNYDESGVVLVNILSNQIAADLRTELLTKCL